MATMYFVGDFENSTTSEERNEAYLKKTEQISLFANIFYIPLSQCLFIGRFWPSHLSKFQKYLLDHNSNRIGTTVERSGCLHRHALLGCNRSDDHHLLLHQNSNGAEKQYHNESKDKTPSSATFQGTVLSGRKFVQKCKEEGFLDEIPVIFRQ